MPEPPGIELGVYTPAMSDEALALEKLCVQGSAYRMSFHRSTFHRRAENYPEWRIFTARVGGRLVGLTAAAIKDVTLLGAPTRATFYFDTRVHPAMRGRGVGRQLGVAADAWGLERASFAYTYTLAENRVAARLAQRFGAVLSGGYSYLVYPVYRRREARCRPEVAAFEEVHAGILSFSPPFDLYANPACRPGSGGYVGSRIVRRGTAVAGCSIWSNRGILGEVIEAVPLSLRIAAALLGRWPLRLARWPHIPAAGEELRSWYLFDFFATDAGLARDLMRHVANEAVEQGIDYCYLPHDPRDSWVGAVRSDVPRLFSPVIPYRLLIKQASGEPPRIDRVYVDVRDL